MEWKQPEQLENRAIRIPERWLHLHFYEALNILFRMENSLRVFVYMVLKNKYLAAWQDCTIQLNDQDQTTIKAAANKRISQAQGFGYLGYEIISPLMFLSSGELTRLIFSSAYWEDFRPYFKGKKEIIQNKLEEVASIRNSLAHFRPISRDDVELTKQNIRHTFVGIENCLNEMRDTSLVVPTNSEDEWYKSLITIKSPSCKIALLQSPDGGWIRLRITYKCKIINSRKFAEEYSNYRLLDIVSSSIVRERANLTALCTFSSYSEPSGAIDKDGNLNVSKSSNLTFRVDTLKNNHIDLGRELTDLLAEIEAESIILEKDNLAKGKYVRLSTVTAQLQKSERGNYWKINSDSLATPVKPSDPPEFWGVISHYADDFVAGTQRYPWMPLDISDLEFPF